jgi:hypothetical protein
MSRFPLVRQNHSQAITMVVYCPFARGSELNTRLDQTDRDEYQKNDLPGYPGTPLKKTQEVYACVQRDVYSPDLDRMSKKLWLMSLQSSSNISPLHRQRVKGRTITITEEPKLHLTWINDRIFVKPLPAYFLSWSFWTTMFDPASIPNDQRQHASEHFTHLDRLRKWSIGYLRTYAFLIQWESDFRIAQEEHLIPTDVSWASFRQLRRELLLLSNTDVCARYHYGELRLSRLNFYARFLSGKSTYQRFNPQYNEYFARFYAPVLFLVAIISTMLNAMQLEISTEQLATPDPPGPGIWVFCRWFSIATLLTASLMSSLLFLVLLFKLWREWRKALRDRFYSGQLSTVVEGNENCYLELGFGAAEVQREGSNA